MSLASPPARAPVAIPPITPPATTPTIVAVKIAPHVTPPIAIAPGVPIPNVKTDTTTISAMIATAANTMPKTFQKSRPVGSM